MISSQYFSRTVNCGPVMPKILLHIICTDKTVKTCRSNEAPVLSMASDYALHVGTQNFSCLGRVP